MEATIPTEYITELRNFSHRETRILISCHLVFIQIKIIPIACRNECVLFTYENNDAEC